MISCMVANLGDLWEILKTSKSSKGMGMLLTGFSKALWKSLKKNGNFFFVDKWQWLKGGGYYTIHFGNFILHCNFVTVFIVTKFIKVHKSIHYQKGNFTRQWWYWVFTKNHFFFRKSQKTCFFAIFLLKQARKKLKLFSKFLT